MYWKSYLKHHINQYHLYYKYNDDNQEVVIPNQVIIDRNSILEKKETNTSTKIELLNQYKNLINRNGLPDNLNIYGDYIKVLKESSNNVKR